MTTGRARSSGRYLLARVRASVDALEHLVGGLGTAVLALGVLLWLLIVAVLVVAVIGIPLLPSGLQAARAVANRERARLSRWGAEVIEPGPLSPRLRTALADPVVHRELVWTALHGTLGFLLGLIGLTLPLYAVQDMTFPLWYRSVDDPDAGGPGLAFWPVSGLLDAFGVALFGVGWLAVAVGLGPGLARLQAWTGRRLLAPTDADLSLRLAQLTATRAAALDAHAVELRRIERSLHDGAQNRLVAVNVLLGAARRSLDRDPDGARELLDRAQDATEQALSELRTVARSILPPVLADRGLAGALSGLASSSGVPCEVDVDLPGRCPASVEATAYFVVAEALTNTAKHSGASHARVTVRRVRDRLILRVEDDGRGGADERKGSGLSGIRRRVEAYDGRLTVTSPCGGPTTMRVELPCGS